jgi:hypothetical protein
VEIAEDRPECRSGFPLLNQVRRVPGWSMEGSCLGTRRACARTTRRAEQCGTSLSWRIRLSKGFTDSGQASGNSAPGAEVAATGQGGGRGQRGGLDHSRGGHGGRPGILLGSDFGTRRSGAGAPDDVTGSGFRAPYLNHYQISLRLHEGACFTLPAPRARVRRGDNLGASGSICCAAESTY